MNPEVVAPIAIRKLLKGKEVIIPGFINRLCVALNKVLPSPVKKMLTGRIAKNMKPAKQIAPALPNSQSAPVAA